MSWILAGDIGRKTTLKLVNTEDGSSHQERYRSDDHPSLASMVKEFRKEKDLPIPDKACFAVPCPVSNNTADLSQTRFQLKWEPLNAQSLNEISKNIQLKLINDFAAVGYGINTLNEYDWFSLYEPEEQVEDKEAKQVATIGAGTGLGVVSYIKLKIKEEETIIVHPSEGGHFDFALPDKQIDQGKKDDDLYGFWLQMKSDKPDARIDMESLVSGQGIVDIYRWLLIGNETQAESDISKLLETWKPEDRQTSKLFDPGAEIAKAALFKSDERCQKAMQIFIEAYAAFASNIALTFLPYGGLYIAGGIAPRILPLFCAPFDKPDSNKFFNTLFGKAYNNKGNAGKNVLPKIPVRVVLNPQVGLKGAEYYARYKIEHDA